MARRRMIDPSIWEDTAFGSLTYPARILFIALFSNADDEGRIAADQRFLRRTAFGFDDVSIAEVDGWLDELAAHIRNVMIYEVDGRRYVQLLGWKDYQTINRPSPSRLPAPPKTRSRKPHESITEHSLNDHGALTDDSRAIEEKGREVKRREEKGREEEPAAKSAPPPMVVPPLPVVIFSESEAEGDGEPEWTPTDADRNAVFAAGTKFITRHNDLNWTEDERAIAFSEFMRKWAEAASAGAIDREITLTRTAHTIYPALGKAARLTTEGVTDAKEEESTTGDDGGTRKRRPSRRRDAAAAD